MRSDILKDMNHLAFASRVSSSRSCDTAELLFISSPVDSFAFSLASPMIHAHSRNRQRHLPLDGDSFGMAKREGETPATSLASRLRSADNPLRAETCSLFKDVR